MVQAVDETETQPDDAPVASAPRRNRRGRRPVLMWIAGFLVVVVGAEAGVRMFGDRLPPAKEYFSAPAQQMVDDMNALRRAGVRSDIAFVGTSMVQDDIDANALEPRLGVKYVHNVALPGAQAPVIERWVTEEVVPRLRPKRVVWGLSSIDFNEGRDRKTIDLYDKARATEEGFYADLDRLLGNIEISRRREALRDPLTLQKALAGTAAGAGSRSRKLGDRAVWTLGFPKLTPAQDRRMRAAHLADVRDHQLLNFRTGTEEVAAYVRTLRALREQGIDAAVVVMPIPQLFLDAHPNGEADFNAWKTAITKEAAVVGVPVFDMSRSMPDEAFHDTEHLEVRYAKQFTAELATRLERMGW